MALPGNDPPNTNSGSQYVENPDWNFPDGFGENVGEQDNEIINNLCDPHYRASEHNEAGSELPNSEVPHTSQLVSVEILESNEENHSSSIPSTSGVEEIINRKSTRQRKLTSKALSATKTQ